MKNKIITIVFCAYLLFMFVGNIIIPKKEISETERRKLSDLPRLTFIKVFNGTNMDDFNRYIDDHFIFRDQFRNLNATIQYDFLKTLDNNKIVIQDNKIYKLDYQTKKESIQNFINKINEVQTDFSSNNHVYYAIIPDKNYYIDSKWFLKLDYDYLYKEIEKIQGEYIELRDVLSLEDYYETDTHWRQENLKRVVDRLGSHLNFQPKYSYTKKEYPKFYGVLYGQSAKKRKEESLYYLTNEIIENATVTYLEEENKRKVYIEENLNSLDPYNVFLDGPSSFIEIENHQNTSGKELVIFRDSFASSLAPLLIENYSKITLIDLRYISKEYYSSYIHFDHQDILFLYSTMLVNDSYTLK